MESELKETERVQGHRMQGIKKRDAAILLFVRMAEISTCSFGRDAISLFEQDH
jgi:hypothetical protein